MSTSSRGDCEKRAKKQGLMCAVTAMRIMVSWIVIAQRILYAFPEHIQPACSEGKATVDDGMQFSHSIHFLFLSSLHWVFTNLDLEPPTSSYRMVITDRFRVSLPNHSKLLLVPGYWDPVRSTSSPLPHLSQNKITSHCPLRPLAGPGPQVNIVD